MKIRKLLPIAFGKFHLKEPIVFEDGLNIVSGGNEEGKSTLGAFILGMLYGFKKEGRSRISRTPEFDKYRPWRGTEYRGVLVYEDGGRAYRVERWFDPDMIKIYDDRTGEDISREFTQDSRRELDFAQRHLGLSAREFKNTIWIGQLGTPQEPGLGVEIQGKIESILQGTGEDLSLGRALSVLAEERAAIKTQRTSRGKLDIVLKKISELKQELEIAKQRENEVRAWMAELHRLYDQKAEIEEDMKKAERDYANLRYYYLKDMVETVNDLQARLSSLEKIVAENAWASQLPPDCEKRFQSLSAELDRISSQYSMARDEMARIASAKRGLERTLLEMEIIRSLGLTQSDFSALRAKYLSCKANAARGERLANEARKELARVEEEGDSRGLRNKSIGEEQVKRAQEYQEIVSLAEKTMDKLTLELEKVKGQANAINPGGAAGWIYALALGVLSLAVVMTLMGIPVASWISFGLALFVFALGALRHHKAYEAKREQEKKIALAQSELDQQKSRVEDAKKVFSEYLAGLGVRTLEELRFSVMEARDYQEKYKRAREKYDFAQNYWFETAAEFSAVEKELLNILRNASALKPGENITDSVLDRLEQKLGELSGIEQEEMGLCAREKELEGILTKLGDEERRVKESLDGLFREVGVSNSEELTAKIIANKRYEESKAKKCELEERLKDLLSGRTIEELLEEISTMAAPLDAGDSPKYSQRDMDSLSHRLSELRDKRNKIQIDISSLEKAISLRSQEGRPSSEIEEELAIERERETELSLQKDALELASSVLEELSAGMRREFAPILNERTGKILRAITRGRYNQVRISPDLEISVIHPDTESAASVWSLSGGTIDQCYFALRVAVAEVITKKDDLPFFLDDPFIQYDSKRLEGVMRVLEELSKRHQVILFCCHGREEELAEKTGISFNSVKLVT